MRNTAIDTGIAAAGGIVGSVAGALSSRGIQEMLIRNGWQTAFGEFVRNTSGSTAFATGNAVTDHLLTNAAADRYGESYGEAPTAQDLGQSIIQGFLFSLISSGIETAASTAAAKAEMNADVAALQQDLVTLMGEIDTEDAATVERFVEDAYQRIVTLEDKIGSTYYAGQQDAVDDALRSLDELSRMIAEDFPSSVIGGEVPSYGELGPVPDALDPPADSGYNGGSQTPLTIDDYNRAAEIAGQGKDTVTYYRVQGGDNPHQRSRETIVINDDGSITIGDKNGHLSVSAYTTEHAEYYKGNRRKGEGYVVAFEVPKWLDEMIRVEAVPQEGYHANPMNQGRTAPKLSDVTTPGYSYELPPPWLEWMEEYASQARIIE